MVRRLAAARPQPTWHSLRADPTPLQLPHYSTREPGEVEEGSRLLRGNGTSSSGAGAANGGSGSKHVGAFDVEFDIEDDVLLNWQHTRCARVCERGWCG